jgi:hypothetical protein
MCFSATASLTAGTALSAIGVASLKLVKKKSERPFAMIPLLFGIQQLSEGVIWLTFGNHAPALRPAMTYLYSFFSHVLWPIYVPFAMGVLEHVRRRRLAIFAFEIPGVAVGGFLLYSMLTGPLTAEVVNRHIEYAAPHFRLIPVMVLYVAATCGSCFVSSHGYVRIFGALALGSFIAAYMVYVDALVSIWCFFAAILSLFIYLHFRFGTFGGARKAPAQPLAA